MMADCHYGGRRKNVLKDKCCNALGMSDVLATGSNDGYLRLWKVRHSELLVCALTIHVLTLQTHALFYLTGQYRRKGGRN